MTAAAVKTVKNEGARADKVQGNITMAKHISLAKIMKMHKRQGEHATTEAERNRIQGLNNLNGRHTYGLRMHRAAANPGSGPCPGGCGRKTSIGRFCISCAKTEEDSSVVESVKEALGL